MFRVARIASSPRCVPPFTSTCSRLSPKLHHNAWRIHTGYALGTSLPQRAYSTGTKAGKHFLGIPGLTTIAVGLAIYSLFPFNKQSRIARSDAPPGSELTSPEAKNARLEIITPERGIDREDQVPTGTSTVPYFPRTIRLPRTGAVDDGKSAALPAGTGILNQEEDYQLLGLGIRTVSFLSIQVYVVGLYVARSDVAKLQEELVREAAGRNASTLVGSEKEKLKSMLLHGSNNEWIWHGVLDTGVKTALRIVPTRSTNFGHLRDGWVRMIMARAPEKYVTSPEFGQSVAEFKALFGARKLEKGKALLLGRAQDGSLDAWVEEDPSDDEKEKNKKNRALSGGAGASGTPRQDKEEAKAGRMVHMGRIEKSWVSSSIWLGYLAGDKVASEGARRSVVDGMMELVERPIGTVETQVV